MRIALRNFFAAYCILLPQLLFAGGDTRELVVETNSGFIQNVSIELRQELPMCDEFLNVKWIRKMSAGYWVGRVVVDVKNGDNTEQRELVVIEDQRKRRHGRFKLVDITETKYRGSQFDELVLSADRVSGKYSTFDSDIIERGLSIWKDKIRVLAIVGICGSQSYLERGVSSRFTQQSNKKICIVHPDKKKWLFKEK